MNPQSPDISALRQRIREAHLAHDADVLEQIGADSCISAEQRIRAAAAATDLVNSVRADDQPGLMEVFLAEYGLSTDEGIALMCLAEALLRVPDAETIDDLIEDKIAPSAWGEHLGRSSSSLVNASTWALMLTGKMLDEDNSSGVAGLLHGAVKRLGEPVIRVAVKHAMKEMGNQFVLGETIDEAIDNGDMLVQQGYTYSYDMLGEAALTAADAEDYFIAYKTAIETLAHRATDTDIRNNPGISIKLSALHPRYELGQRRRVMEELTEKTLALTLVAKQANMGLNIDAEEADRLDLSLDVIEAVLQDERLAGWDGFGVVVQAYGKRAAPVIDWLYELAGMLSRKLMVRLVKGAYWDAEIKRAQVEGVCGFPVYTNKAATDVSYIACAAQLLSMSDRLYPQFATHNAHTACAVLELAEDTSATFEFQRLHGMGEAMHRHIRKQHNSRCRIYAPVGAHRDLLAYLVRRLLENGANSSFVNQLVDESVPASELAIDPFTKLYEQGNSRNPFLKHPAELFAPDRKNSRGWDLHNHKDLASIEAVREPYRDHRWSAAPLVANKVMATTRLQVSNPANDSDIVGEVLEATAEDVDAAIAAATPWQESAGDERRSTVLNTAADLYEENVGELMAVLAREAGKTPMDAIAELREAVDFLRYYAGFTEAGKGYTARGLIVCISPWNFPLAIFTGQISAALAAGNAVIAKPAESTSLVAVVATKLLHKAGVPLASLQLLPGTGSTIGAALVQDARIDGVCFTGSTATAQHINRAMAANGDPGAPLVAETGGLNAMIVDSTALPQQAIKDVVISAFQSAGQRCSALRLLYLQTDVADEFLAMLYGAMDELMITDPWSFASDSGPLINDQAKQSIQQYIDNAHSNNSLLKQQDVPNQAHFIGPAVIRVDGMHDLEREVFGPVLHVATFEARDIGKITQEINDSGYGLTFGLHTRIDDRVEHLTSRIRAGNLYINRNQIGAIVGSQPFGGEGLSGTGPKAGGPHYVKRFTRPTSPDAADSNVVVEEASNALTEQEVQSALAKLPQVENRILGCIDLPGPTGESNRLYTYPRGVVLCLGPNATDAASQASMAEQCGCVAMAICPGANTQHCMNGHLSRSDLASLAGFDAVILWSDKTDQSAARNALAHRDGPLIPLVTDKDVQERCVVERHICIDTTASGGNASLLASV